MHHPLQQEAYCVCTDPDRGRSQTTGTHDGVQCGNCHKECDAVYKETRLSDDFEAWT